MGGTSFFCRFSAERIWKGVTGVSSAGRKRGRGSGSSKKLVIDFNKGQRIGEGPRRIKIPYLNTPHTVNTAVRPEIMGLNPEFRQNLNRLRDRMVAPRKRAINPLDRGWSGRFMHGSKVGPPDDVGGIPFEGFETIVLQARPLFRMTGTTGRKKTIGALVVTGNKKGLAGFALASGADFRSSVTKARNRAAQSLVKINLSDNHTVMHDFHSRYYYTTVFVERKPSGHGVRAHRVIRAICEVFGIKDMYAKVLGGSTAVKNVSNITKAFFLGLMNQKSYQEIADEKGLHLVELRDEHYNFPRVLASPQNGIRPESSIKISENLDFTYYINDGRIRQIRPPVRHPYTATPSWQKHLDYEDYVKNREKTKLEFAARYEDKSVFEVFPEFKTQAFKPSEPDDDAVSEDAEKSEESN